MKIDLKLADMLELADLLGLNEEERQEVQLPTKTKIDDNKKCLNCGKPIDGLPYNPKFCSFYCGKKFRTVKRKLLKENNWEDMFL